MREPKVSPLQSMAVLSVMATFSPPAALLNEVKIESVQPLASVTKTP